MSLLSVRHFDAEQLKHEIVNPAIVESYNVVCTNTVERLWPFISMILSSLMFHCIHSVSLVSIVF